MGIRRRNKLPYFDMKLTLTILLALAVSITAQEPLLHELDADLEDAVTAESAIPILSVKASSAECDGCRSNNGCDPRGPARLISPCDATVCATTWGCGGSCDASVLTINGNGQGEWCSKKGSLQWLDLTLAPPGARDVTRLDIWSGVSAGRFPDTMQIYVKKDSAVSAVSAASGGGNGCFDLTSNNDLDSNWQAKGDEITLECQTAKTAAGVNTQKEDDKCSVDIPSAVGRTIRVAFKFSSKSERVELRKIQAYGRACDRSRGTCANWCYNSRHAAKGWLSRISGQKAEKCKWKSCCGCPQCGV